MQRGYSLSSVPYHIVNGQNTADILSLCGSRDPFALYCVQYAIAAHTCVVPTRQHTTSAICEIKREESGEIRWIREWKREKGSNKCSQSKGFDVLQSSPWRSPRWRRPRETRISVGLELKPTQPEWAERVHQLHDAAPPASIAGAAARRAPAVRAERPLQHLGPVNSYDQYLWPASSVGLLGVSLMPPSCLLRSINHHCSAMTPSGRLLVFESRSLPRLSKIIIYCH